jgi:predicted metal-dependent hydrolase
VATSRVAIHVNPDGSVSVDAPSGFADDSIKDAVQKRARWVVTHVNEANQRYAHVWPKEYVSGEQVLYLGRRYMLKVIPVTGKPAGPRLIGNQLEVQSATGDMADIRGRVRAWYRVKGRDYFARRIDCLVKTLPCRRASWPRSATQASSARRSRAQDCTRLIRRAVG